MYVNMRNRRHLLSLSLEHRRVIVLRAINQFRFLYFILIVRLSYVLLLLLRCRRRPTADN